MGQPRKRDKGVVDDGTGTQWASPEHSDADIELQPQDDLDYQPDPDWGTRFVFPKSRFAAAVHSIEKANRRLARSGVEERFTYEFKESVENRDGREYQIVTVTLNRPRIGFAGWVFTGAHDFTPDGDVISHKLGEDTPDVTESRCDYCGKTRHRGRVYTLHSETEGDKQVGKSCLRLFLGVTPEGLWALTSDAGLDENDDETDMTWYTANDQVLPATDMLAVAINLSDGGTNFVPRSRASRENPATADKVLDAWDAHKEAFTPEDTELAKNVQEWLAGEPEDGDYISNLKAALVSKTGEPKHVLRKHVPLAVSAVSAYQRAQEKAIAKKVLDDAKQSYTPGFIAEQGEKFAGVGGKVLRTRRVDGTYGTTTIVTLVTDDGHQTTWFASGYKEFQPGQKVTIAGTVKGHDEYDGADQTIITRAKLTDPDTGEKLG